MIKLIGTNHLMKKEVIEGILKDENPDIIGLELCEFRVDNILNQLKVKTKEDKSILGKITSSIKRKADEQGLDYGSDQKTALRFAIENKLPYVLVDMPILKIQELFLKIPLNEQEGFTRELQEFESVNINEQVNEEKVIYNLQTRYPIAFEFLINMRNVYIANQILIAEKRNPKSKIVIILGSSHVTNVNKLIGN